MSGAIAESLRGEDIESEVVPLVVSDNEASRLIDRLVSEFKSMGQVRTEVEDARAVSMGLGWAIRMCRTASAVALLHEDGYGLESSPLVRSMIEHAFWMQCLADAGEEVLDRVEFQHRGWQRRLIESMDEGTWDVDAMLVEAGGTPPSDHDLPTPSDTLTSFKNVLTHLRQTDWYVAYRLESAQSHASYMSGAVYATDLTSADGVPVFNYEGGTENPAPLGVTAAMLVMGLSALSEMSPLGPDLAGLLAEAEAQLEVPEE